MSARGKLMALCAFAAVLVPSVVQADNPKPASALSDMKVSRDKETGQLRAPTAEEDASLASKARMLVPNVVVLRRPVTTVEIRSDGSAVAKRSLDDLDNLVITRGADGRAVIGHAGPTKTPAASTAPAK